MRIRAPLICVLLALVAARAAAQCPTGVLISTEGNGFGTSVSVHGARVLVGDPSVYGEGAAYVAERTSWSWNGVGTLQPFAGVPGAKRFGAACALGAELALVGAPDEAGKRGALYVYELQGEGWTQVARLVVPDAEAGDLFGAALALDGVRAVVGAPGDDELASNAGAAFLVERGPTGWALTHKLLAATVSSGAGFGNAVAIEGGRLALGAPNVNQVAVFDLHNGQWTQSAMLLEAGVGQFGQAVGLSGARIAVGAPGTPATFVKSGAVYVYEHDGLSWGPALQLQPDVPAVFLGFGTALALDDERLVVNAPGADESDGAVYLFEHAAAAWTQKSVFVNLPGPDYMGLGASLALDDDVLALGALFPFGPAPAVYMYGGLVSWTDLGGSVGGASGVPVLAASGALCAGTNVSVRLDGAPPGAPSVWFAGFSQLGVPFKGGTMVPLAGLVLPKIVGADGGTLLSATWPAGLPSGVALYVQAWIVDATGPFGFTASNALRGLTP